MHGAVRSLISSSPFLQLLSYLWCCKRFVWFCNMYRYSLFLYIYVYHISFGKVIQMWYARNEKMGKTQCTCGFAGILDVIRCVSHFFWNVIRFGGCITFRITNVIRFFKCDTECDTQESLWYKGKKVMYHMYHIFLRYFLKKQRTVIITYSFWRVHPCEAYV